MLSQWTRGSRVRACRTQWSSVWSGGPTRYSPVPRDLRDGRSTICRQAVVSLTARRWTASLLTPHQCQAITATGADAASRRNQTTAAAMSTPTAHVAPLRVMQPLQSPLVIPNNQIFTHSSLTSMEEQISIMLTCLKLGNVERAHHMLKLVMTNYPQERARFTDVNLHNCFLEAYLLKPAQPDTRQALYWFDEMKRFGAEPSVTSYAILIKGLLRTQTINTAKLLLKELVKDGHSIEAFMANRFMSDDDLRALKLLRGNRSKPVVDQMTIEHTLLEEPAKETLPSTTGESSLTQVPEAISTNVLGVRLLKRSLDPVAAKDLDRYERQLQLEQQAMVAALERIKSLGDAQSTEMRMSSTPMRRLMWDWHQQLVPLIRDEQARAANVPGNKVDRTSYSFFLMLLDAERLSVITIQQMLRQYGNNGVHGGIKTGRIVAEVGKAVEQEYCADQIRSNSNSVLNTRRINLQSLYSSGRLFDTHVRNLQAKLLVESPEENWLPAWPKNVRIKIGSLLSSMLMNVAKVKSRRVDAKTKEVSEEMADAFFHSYQFSNGHRIGVIRFHSELTEMFSRDNVREAIDPRMLPMLVLPRPWIRFDSGGYLSRKNLCMRIKSSPEQYRYLKEASNQERITMVLNGLDVLGSTPWTINRKVFDVALFAWNSGKQYPSIPPLVTELKLPEKPAEAENDRIAYLRWINAVKKTENDYRNFHSQRCDTNYKIEIARAFLGETVYFPHNLDFRGRAYPIPPLFNHLGNDICRGLLLFAEAKPLGERGLRWLKIHLASLSGYDKHSFSDRIKFVDESLPMIFDSADHPIDGKQWWLKAEDPWQCLAACMELTEALRSPNPHLYKSRLPVHQDGTCNGLQHYAALGGDMAGATQVNLLPSDHPQDVYSGVCELVNSTLDKEAAEGVEEAIALKGLVSRKIVKQTVMTNVYGVTFIGAREQIAARLRELEQLNTEDTWRYSTYLTHKVFASLGEIFSGARALQDWLNEAARRIAKSVPPEAFEEIASVLDKKSSSGSASAESGKDEKAAKPRVKKDGRGSKKAGSKKPQQMTCVIWTTPLGLPIVQPYRRASHRLVNTVLQTVYVTDPSIEMPVNAQKQRTAFPPNFIHSLDATHMMLSAIACQREGLTFAAVHDSYWTHARDIDKMNETLRDQFVVLHTQSLMENLRNEFIERYKGYKMPAGVLDVNESAASSKSSDASAADQSADAEETSKLAIDPMAPADEELEHDDADHVVEVIHECDSTIQDGIEDLAELKATQTPTDDAATLDAADADATTADTAEAMLSSPTTAESATTDAPDAPNVPAEPTNDAVNETLSKANWVNLEFPPLPPRGEFNVASVGDSSYFFH